MRKILIAAVFVTAMLFDLRPAPAGWTAPWCAVLTLGNGDAYWDCQYASVEACRPNVLAGNRGFCNPNPAWNPAAAVSPRKVRRHRVHHG
ncbi:DUF3551 domain-containing protein [Microbacteriaceae bacterium K1510]|nr:DUF3551 domain-containing protein [Microbacteriaceae bacterium K1510]